MTKRHHISVACCIGTVLCGCAALDEQMTGIASPEVAMYTAQIEFADAFCRNANLVDDPAKSQKYVTLVHNIMQVKDQRKYRPEFPVFYSDSHRKFSAAGSRMSSNKKRQFCSSYGRELDQFSKGIRSWDQLAMFTGYHSTPTEQQLQCAQTAGIAGAALATAAVVSSVQYSSSGDIGAGQAMAGVASTIGHSLQAGERPGYCSAYQQFKNHNAPQSSKTWSSFHSLIECVHPKHRVK
ncbi:MAG: hypothetical protein GY883_05500 [Shimia sp.]|nr:hypothetical protein [Shimia sp.]